MRLGALDYILTAAVALLVLFTPMAFGSVHPWAFGLMEAGIFFLVIIWAAALLGRLGEPVALAAIRIRTLIQLAIPVLVLFGLVGFQLLPLSPSLIRVISPASYTLYAQALPGWPHKIVFPEEFPSAQAENHGDETLSAVSSARIDSPKEEDTSKSDIDNWYPLSIAPSLTKTALLKLAAYAGLFFTVLGYPFVDGAEGEKRFYRTIIAVVLASGFLVALVGLIERVYWNGKILWFFIPQDWGAPKPGFLPRASGPFVDPDHFADYLAMVLPLALAQAFFGSPIKRKRTLGVFRLICTTIAFVTFAAILLSLSRAGWVEATAAGLILTLLWFRTECRQDWKSASSNIACAHPRKTFHDDLPAPPRWIRARSFPHVSKTIVLSASLAAFLCVVTFALFIVGPRGREQANERLEVTVAHGGGIGVRPAVWKSSLEMLRDFPIFGVGLGAWPEIFPHYQAGPWNEYYLREAHNDYLQYACETGLIGFLALIWCFALAGALFRSRGGLSEEEWPILVALVLALGGAAFHELVDFSLHVPANAFLFTLLLAIATRMAAKPEGIGTRCSNRAGIRIGASAAIIAGAVLIVLALAQKGLAYPHDIEAAGSSAEARAVVLAHPVSAQAHIRLLTLAGENMSPGMRLNELAVAVRLDPTDPSIRDLYARALIQSGRRDEALAQIATSVFNSPTAGTHFYLGRKVITRLLPAEQVAVEHGFKEAIAAHYPGAIEGLGVFYDNLKRFSEEASLYASAAEHSQTRNKRAAYLTAAAEANIRNGRSDFAEVLFHRAIQADPAYREPYVNLITEVYGPANNMRAAQHIVRKGIANGSDPVRLYTALSTAAQLNGNENLAESALLRALQYDSSVTMITRLAQLYLQDKKVERAVSMLRNATEIDPDSADAFYLLGQAEERDYQYTDADKAYARAALLAPKQFRPAYSAFRQRMNGPKSDG